MVIQHDKDGPAQASQLFTLRLWPEDLGDGQTDWRVKVQHVNSGEVRYFRDWSTLEAFLEALLGGKEKDPPRRRQERKDKQDEEKATRRIKPPGHQGSRESQEEESAV
jgi:hypothetical protein